MKSYRSVKMDIFILVASLLCGELKVNLPFKCHNNCQSNWCIEDDIIERIENFGEDKSVNLRVNVKRPSPDSGQAVIKDSNRCKNDVTEAHNIQTLFTKIKFLWFI